MREARALTGPSYLGSVNNSALAWLDRQAVGHLAACVARNLRTR